MVTIMHVLILDSNDVQLGFLEENEERVFVILRAMLH